MFKTINCKKMDENPSDFWCDLYESIYQEPKEVRVNELLLQRTKINVEKDDAGVTVDITATEPSEALRCITNSGKLTCRLQTIDR